MDDQLASDLLAAVHKSRVAVRIAEARVVEARTEVWARAVAAGVSVRTPRCDGRPPAVTELAALLDDRTDPLAERLRAAHEELEAAEIAASAAHDRAAAAARQFRAALPESDRRLDLGEARLAGRGGDVHRFHALVDVRGRPRRTARAAICGQRRGLGWRTVDEKPSAIQLCAQCHGDEPVTAAARPALPSTRLPRPIRLPTGGAVRRV